MQANLQNANFVKIRGRIQDYQWGGTEFLPQLLGYHNAEERPQAEYWLGAHPSGCASIEGSEPPLLIHQFLANHHQAPLQFLLKVLDVQDMLSIQVHPSLAQAEAGFARENALGIALDAKHRNYKDSSDKPELMVALSDFWLLHGLRQPQEIADDLTSKPYLHALLTRLQEKGLTEAFAWALGFSNPDVQNMQQNLAEDVLPQNSLDKHSADFWIKRWLEKNPTVFNGILTLLFMNVVHISKGTALYQPAGLLHAYLEGKNIELMANSDNVLRAGLTPKHIDVAELLNISQIKPTNPQDFIITPIQASSHEWRYPTPFQNFELARLSCNAQDELFEIHSTQPEIIFCYEGILQLTDKSNHSISLQKGDSALLMGNTITQARFLRKNSQAYKARNL